MMVLITAVKTPRGSSVLRLNGNLLLLFTTESGQKVQNERLGEVESEGGKRVCVMV